MTGVTEGGGASTSQTPATATVPSRSVPETAMEPENNGFWSKLEGQDTAAGGFTFQKRVGIGNSHSFETWDFLKSVPSSYIAKKNRHKSGNTAEQDSWQHWTAKQSTRETKFGKGFMRKQIYNTNIIRSANPNSSTQYTGNTMRLTAQQHPGRSNLKSRRRDRLCALQDRNGFDIITGTTNHGVIEACDRSILYSSNSTSNLYNNFNSIKRERDARTSSNRGRRHFKGGGLSDASKIEADLILRSSSSRFYADIRTTANATLRTKTLKNDGLKPGAKMCSLLGIGRADLPSQGVNDNFGNSVYLQRSRSAGTLLLDSLTHNTNRPTTVGGALHSSRSNRSNRSKTSARRT